MANASDAQVDNLVTLLDGYVENGAGPFWMPRPTRKSIPS